MELKTQARSVTGKKVKTLRKEGFIPAELYGKGIENKHISVSEKDFAKVFKEAGENTVINLALDEKENLPVMIADVHFDNLTNKFLSVDFHKIRMDEKIEAEIPVELVGDAPAAKRGLVVVKVMNEISVSAIPAKLPHKFEVDISKITEEGDSIHIKDLKVEKDVKILSPEDSVIVIANKIEEEKEEPAPQAVEENPQAAETPAETEGEKE